MSVVLVTGGGRGIGRAIVEEFSASGSTVAFTYAQNGEAARQLVDCLRSQDHDVHCFQADAADYNRASEVIEEIQRDIGPITVLVNNAGIRRDGSFLLMDPVAWHAVLDTNLTGTFNYSRILMRDFVRRGGCVINMTSVSGQMGIAGQTNYSASKAAIIGFTKSLAKEVARFGVRVNAIAPGFIDTDMTASMDENARRKQFSQIPVGRPGSPRDVARLARFLAEDAAEYVTGQVWAVDGGLS
jgi:3-oxoacyl-[acyl-carrier protein] reductase